MKDIKPEDAMQWKSDKIFEKCSRAESARRRGPEELVAPLKKRVKKCKTLA
jgi:hypothetical protein